jgi:ubiquinol-cytochrome c reductase cytochrome b subunit
VGLTFVPLKVVGAEGGYDCGAIPCDEMKPDPSDKVSLQHGAQLYMNYCMGCHSLQYARYNRMGEDLGIPDDLVKENLIFDPAVKVGSFMENAMPEEQSEEWFGKAPPDLTLVSRARQPEWLYTYLRTFYVDKTRPYGVNNLVFANVGMPHVLTGLQGTLECAPTDSGDEIDPLTGDSAHADPCGELVITEPGTMDEEEFDSAMYNLVNFLAYNAEPMKAERQRLGVYALLFIAVFFIFSWLLNREYWKDIH